MKKLILLLLIVVLQHAVVAAQFPPVTIPGSQSRKINSAIVGQEYELQILLPGGYANSNKKYPVVYLMDSQWDFPLVKSIYGQQYYDGFIPELILVGVTWGGTNPNPDSLRARDYTPTKENRSPQSGGADKFLSFLKNELFPFIETNYKADSNRVLMGCSLGGLFTIYTLFTQPDLFTGYVAASPAVGWDKEVLYRFEKNLAQTVLTKNTRLYMTVGDVERNRPAYEKFASKITSSKYPSLTITSKILENTGHSGTKSETYSRGLQYVFEKPKLLLDNNVLNRHVGTYTAGNTIIELKNENENLVLYYSANNKINLFAASDKLFYAISELLNISFESIGAKQFVLERYGSKTVFIKND